MGISAQDHVREIGNLLDKHRAEVERLRAALKEIDDIGASWPIEDAYYKACGIAQEALQTKGSCGTCGDPTCDGNHYDLGQIETGKYSHHEPGCPTRDRSEPNLSNCTCERVNLTEKVSK